MRHINRSVVILRVKQPFLDWAQSVAVLDGLTLAKLHDDCVVYLLPVADLDEVDGMMTAFFDLLFVEQLEAWYRDPATWPTPRTFAMFKEWFDIEYHSAVVDVLDDKLKKEKF